MDSDEIKNAIVEWVEVIGPQKAHLKLVGLNLSPSMAEKLIGNRYSAEIRKKNRLAIIRQLRKDGVLVDKAS